MWKKKKNIEKKHISDNAGIPNMGMQAYLSGPSYRPNGLLNNHGNRVTVTQRFWTSSLHSAFNFLGGYSQPMKDGPLHFMFVYLGMYSSFRGENAEESRFLHLCSISWITGQGRSSLPTWSSPAHLRGHILVREQRLHMSANCSSRALWQDCHHVGICLGFYPVPRCQLLDDSSMHERHPSLAARQRTCQWMNALFISVST